MVASAAMKIFFGRWLLALLGRMPLPVVGMFASGVAAAIRTFGRHRLQRSESNIARAFPALEPGQRSRLVRENSQALVRTALECGPIWHREADWIRARLPGEAEGRALLERLHAEGRGVLMLGGHLGNWELTILFGSLVLPVDFLYKPPKSETLDRLLTARRSRFGAHMVPTGGAAMRQVVRSLRSGGAVGLLFDQLPRGGDFVEAPFFGHPVATMTLPHRLIRSTGCAVVMGHFLRTADGRGWRARIEEVPGADDPDPARAAAAMNRVLENAVRAAPEQYLWEYRRFQQLDREGSIERRGRS